MHACVRMHMVAADILQHGSLMQDGMHTDDDLQNPRSLST